MTGSGQLRGSVRGRVKWPRFSPSPLLVVIARNLSEDPVPLALSLLMN